MISGALRWFIIPLFVAGVAIGLGDSKTDVSIQPVFALVDTWFDMNDFRKWWIGIKVPTGVPFYVGKDALSAVATNLSNGASYEVAVNYTPPPGLQNEATPMPYVPANPNSAIIIANLQLPTLPAGMYRIAPEFERGFLQAIPGDLQKLERSSYFSTHHDDVSEMKLQRSSDIPIPVTTAQPFGGPDVNVYISAADRGQSHIVSTVKLYAMYGWAVNAPIVQDDALDELKRQFLNRPVWLYGDIRFTCYLGWNQSSWQARPVAHAPVLVTSIERIAHFGARLSAGAIDPLNGCTITCREGYHVFTHSPILVTVDPVSTEFEVLRPLTLDRGLPPKNCVEPSTLVIDAWDFRRKFALEDPRSTHPEWPDNLRTAMLQFKLLPGMSREMAAYAKGYPTDLDPEAKFDQMDTWTWYQGSTSEVRAHFIGDQIDRIYPDK